VTNTLCQKALFSDFFLDNTWQLLSEFWIWIIGWLLSQCRVSIVQAHVIMNQLVVVSNSQLCSGRQRITKVRTCQFSTRFPENRSQNNPWRCDQTRVQGFNQKRYRQDLHALGSGPVCSLSLAIAQGKDKESVGAGICAGMCVRRHFIWDLISG